MWCCTPLIAALWNQMKVDVCEFKASLVYIKSSRRARATQRETFFKKSQMLNIANKDLGARCWGENLLAQRGRESTQLTFLLSDVHAFSYKTPTGCPSLLFPMHLSPLSCLSITLYGFFLSIGCLLHLLTYVDFI